MNQDVVVTRIINAPLAVVWKLWTDPKEVVKWWGPADYTSPSARNDLRQGGSYVFTMQAPDYQGKQVSHTSGEYTDVVPMQKLVFTQGLSDADGKRLPDDELPEDFPSNIETTVEFKEVNGMTELKITEHGWKLSKMSVYAYAGMHQSLDKMSAMFQ